MLTAAPSESMPGRSPLRRKGRRLRGSCREGSRRLLGLSAILLLILIAFGVAIELLPEGPVIGVAVFGFHRIVDSTAPGGRPFAWRDSIVDYPRPRLEAFLEHLARGPYWTLSADELLRTFIAPSSGAIPPEHVHQRPVALTFDDGDRSIHTQLLPILERLRRRYGRQIRVILFINSGKLGRREGGIDYISCEELREGFRKGFYDIQSHTVNHFDLTRLPEKELIHELSQDQIALKRCIAELDVSHSVAQHIAYPYGALSPRVEHEASRRFRSGYLYGSHPFQWAEHSGTAIDRYRIPRLIVHAHDSPDRLTRLADSAAASGILRGGPAARGGSAATGSRDRARRANG